MTGHHLEGDLGAHGDAAAAVGDVGAVEEQSPASEVYVVGSDGSNPLRVARGPLGVLSHDGSQVLFSRDGEIAVATRDRGMRLLTRRPFYDASPSWSPDGGRVAFSRDTTTRHGPHEEHVHVMNADGTAVRALTAGPSNDQAPVWSPDGTRLHSCARATSTS